MVLDIAKLNDIEYCRNASPFKVLEELTDGNIRGLDLLALRRVLSRNRLPLEVVNVLLFYFYRTYANKAFDRNDLMKVYDFWLKKHVRTYSEAIRMLEKNIEEVIGRQV